MKNKRHYAAMCMWEYVLDNTDGTYKALFANNAYCAARARAAALVKPCAAAWKIAHVKQGGSFEGSYDWEWVPWFFNNCVDGDLNLLKDWETITRNEWVLPRKYARYEVRSVLEVPSGTYSFPACLHIGDLAVQMNISCDDVVSRKWGWSIYGVYADGTIECIGDYTSCKTAERIISNITGKPYKSNFPERKAYKD